MGDREPLFPDHLQAIPELDVTPNLQARSIDAEWFALAISSESTAREGGLEEDILRYSLLINKEEFCQVFPRLRSIGDNLYGLGSAGGFTSGGSGAESYSYKPFYSHFLGDIVAEPLVFHPESQALGARRS